MRAGRWLTVLMILGIAACSTKSPAGPSSPGASGGPSAGNTISGRVLVDGVGLPGVTVTASTLGESPHTQRTDGAGLYSLEGLPGSIYAVSISGAPPDVVFDFVSTIVTISGGRGGVDFTGHRVGRGLISTSTTHLAFTHQVHVSPCPQTVDDLTITNTALEDVKVTLSSDNPALQVASDEAVVPAGAIVKVPVAFNCSTQTSFTATVTIRAESPGGTVEMHAIDVAVTIAP